MSRFKIILKRTLIVLLSVIALVALGIFIVLRFYEDEVVGFAIKRINSQISTTATVSSADLTFWESFPKASIKFSDVYIQETFASKDTLVAADKVFFAFDIWDIFKGKYEIDEIQVENGKVHLSVDRKGKDNWHFLKESNDSTASDFNIRLETVKVEGMSLVYENAKSEFFIDLKNLFGTVEGEFSESTYETTLDVETTINQLYNGSTDLAQDRKVSLEAVFLANTESERYDFENCKLNIDGIPLLVNGYYKNGETSQIDMSFRGDDITLNEALQVIPADYKASLSDYNADGVVSFDARLSGAISEKSRPKFESSFSLSNGQVSNGSSGLALTEWNVSGNYKYNDRSDRIQLDKFSARLEGGLIELSGSLEQMKDPTVDLRMKVDVGLTELKEFFNWDTLSICEGKIYAQAEMKGKLLNSAYTLTGKGELTDAKMQLVNSNRLFTDVGSTILFDNKNAIVQRLVGNVNGSDFELNGTLVNLIPFLLKDGERLVAEASWKSRVLDFSQLLETESSTKSNKDYLFELPKNLDFSLQSNIGKFKFGKFEATDIRGLIVLRGGALYIDPVSLNTADGSFLSQVKLEPYGSDSYMLSCAANMTDINIQKLFVSFDNFGQTFITDVNLRGKATSAVQMSVPLSKSLDIQTDKLYALIDIGIANGELIGLESLQEIAKYLRSNKWIAPFVDEDKFAERMKDIKFSYLENVIEIKDKKITIPMMDIKSTALDISVTGKHGFDNTIDYTVGFRLRDILLKKDRGEADDGLGKQMFIYMRGTTDNPEFGVDKGAAKAERQEAIAAEKNNIKALLKQEFGLFKNDQNVGSYQEEKVAPQATTTIQWDENDASETPAEEEKATPVKLENETKKTEAPKETKNGKKLPKWLQEKE